MMRPAVLILLVAALSAVAADTVPLWPGGAPGAVGQEDADEPSHTIYLPESPSPLGAGVVVCPGGGYGHLAVDHEGVQIAEWLNANGIAAFVLRYRIAPRYHHPAPLQDAQRAIRYVRSLAGELGVNPERLGIWGFSAGGHLASTAGTHFDRGDAATADPVERQSCRPDFLILAYPVITFTEPHTHRGSRRNLIGDPPDPKLVEHYSNEKRVSAETPPAFLFHTTEDTAVPVENSILFYSAMRRYRVPAEMHIYEPGRHGAGLAVDHPALSTWGDLLLRWLKTRSLLG